MCGPSGHFTTSPASSNWHPCYLFYIDFYTELAFYHTIGRKPSMERDVTERNAVQSNVKLWTSCICFIIISSCFYLSRTKNLLLTTANQYPHIKLIHLSPEAREHGVSVLSCYKYRNNFHFPSWNAETAELELVPQPTAGSHAGPPLKAPDALKFCNSSNQEWRGFESDPRALKALLLLPPLTPTGVSCLLRPRFSVYSESTPLAADLVSKQNFDGDPPHWQPWIGQLSSDPRPRLSSSGRKVWG